MRQLLLCISLLSASAQDTPPVPETFRNKPDRVITIVAERFSFSPAKVKLKQGQHAEFVITSDDTDHGFRIVAANVEAVIPQQGKGELRIRFLARQKGSYTFECSRPCGAGHNMMRGVIVVE